MRTRRLLARSVREYVCLAVLAAALSLASGVAAHHGWSGYDATRALTLKGIIKESGYEHPHGYLRLEVPGKLWLVVLAPPSRMERRELTAAMLAPGTPAIVVGYQNRTDPVELRAERITIGDKTIELR